MPLTKEPLKFTPSQWNREETLIQEALSKPMVKVLTLDTLLGEPIEGYEGIYWATLPDDLTETGLIKSGNGVIVPCTTHIPTGSKTSYRKVFKVIGGKKIPVWEVHQKDLTKSHEPYDLS
jgi:hypothetical protein